MKIVWKSGGVAAPAVALALAVTACSSTVNLTQPPRALPLLSRLHTLTTIGAATDPISGDQNPYGLAIAPVTSGLVTAGDLIVCDFNDGPTNTQGQGESIIGIHPVPGSQPYRIAHDPSLLGCNAVAMFPTNGFIWASDFGANNVTIWGPNGSDVATLSTPAFPWSNPFGQIFGMSAAGVAAFFVSNAGDGSVDRVTIANGTIGSTTVIATGFGHNGGAPGGILAPSGLTYNPAIDTLYVVDGDANTVSAIANASTVSSPAVPKVIASGAPLNGPISAALLPDGNLVVGNTLDPAGKNLLLEVSASGGGVLAVKNVDTGAAGALFGIVATGTVSAPKIYFNDDNANAVVLVSN